MAYMLFERVAMEIVAAYRDRPEAERQLEAATAYRAWLEALPIDPVIRAGLVEPIAAVEDGLRETLRRRERDTATGSGATIGR